MNTLRVGTVPYLVGRPLDSGLAEEPGIELVHDVPAKLVERLRAGDLDVALVSSIELFRRPGYRYLDGLAVAGRGYVGSVQLFLEGTRTIEEVNEVALDPASRTARTLVRVLLADRPGGPPAFREVPVGEDPRAVGADAWLRIGDAALREHLDEGIPCWNPSEQWARTTGLPFVFAPWIVREGVEIAPYAEAFRRSAERGGARIASLAAEAARAWSLPQERCQAYLGQECRFEWAGEELRESLTAFRDRAAALDLCRADLDPASIALGRLHA